MALHLGPLPRRIGLVQKYGRFDFGVDHAHFLDKLGDVLDGPQIEASRLAGNQQGVGYGQGSPLAGGVASADVDDDVVVFLAHRQNLGAHGSARQLDAGVGRGGQTVGGGIMLTRRLFGFEARAKGELVRAEGLEPSRALRPHGFSYPSTAFAAPAVVPQGLGSGLSLHRARIWLRGLGAARLVSTPSRPVVRPGLARDRHFTGFPDFEQFCTAGFPTGTQVLSLKSDASADSATPARF